MADIRLTPSGSLRWDPSDADAPGLAAPRKTFEEDWREGLFTLAATKAETGGSQTILYWRGIAEHFLTGLCHLPSGSFPASVQPPSESECATWVLTAPPMQGGEYLSPESLLGIWRGLTEWCNEAAGESLADFLQSRAPRWHQVGRVCFHLAENKSDPERPFAFMATYIPGLGETGQARHKPLRQALEEYAGANNRAGLVKLLLPVHTAAERCPWVKAMVESGELYQPMAWPPKRAYQLLLAVPQLEESGLSVRLPNWWQRRPRPRVSVRIGQSSSAMLSAGAMLDFRAGVALGDDTLSQGEVEALLSGADGLVLVKGQWVEVDREKLQEAIAQWKTVQEMAKDGSISFIEGMRLLAGASGDLRHEEKADELRPWVDISAGEGLRGILAAMRNPAALEHETGSLKDLRATLRPYQQHGVAWLRFLSGLGLGACLADDMGLGKTIQVLALLLRQRGAGAGGPSLLVVPASLLGNWRAEAARFAPSLRLVFVHPAEAKREDLDRILADPEKNLSSADLVITTYSMIHRQESLTSVPWRLVILDEAQAIKNSGTRQSKAVRKLKAQSRIVLTGTPVENRLGDLWSLFDFLNPGLLGSAAVFKSFVGQMEKRQSDQFAPLRKLVSPYILRRMKTDRSIIADLPDKVETTRFCNLTREQVRIYQLIVKDLEKGLEGADGIKRRGLVLQTLMRLKQACNHPSQATGDGGFLPAASGKFLRLAEICEELAERQERVLVFTQFREIIDPIESHLRTVFGRPGLTLHGETEVKKRKLIVEQFQREDGPPFFVLSLKAGGTGLTLTGANHVIHFDRWWNPAVEDQATDRAFRIGQKRNVLVHKFVTSGTLEERIDRMIAGKRHLANEILTGSGEVDLTSLGDRELIELVRLDIGKASGEGV